MPVRAIETAYKGYRFRSRLEARWAVFFDALGIEWQYEPEGFELPNGQRYLPDFFLPRFNGACGLWAEVKPKGDRAEKARAFVEASGQPLLILDGDPGVRLYTVLDVWDSDDGIVGETDCAFLDKYLPGGVNGSEYRLFFHAGDWDLGFCGRRVLAAIAAARGARFEYGECGAAR